MNELGGCLLMIAAILTGHVLQAATRAFVIDPIRERHRRT